MLAATTMLTTAVSGREAGSAPHWDARAAFESLKRLAGDWQGNLMTPDGPPMSARYRVTSGGSVVEEVLFPGTEQEMVSMYHMDGKELVMTHYCAAGNQPTMRARPSKDASSITFDFVRGSNMKPGDLHMHSVRIALAGEDRVETEWTTWSGGKAADSAKFSLARQK